MSSQDVGTSRSRRLARRAARMLERRGGNVRLDFQTAMCRTKSCRRIFYATRTRLALDARNEHEKRHR